MNPGVKAVKPLADYKLLLVFDDGDRRIFDVTPWLKKGAFRELRDEAVFRTARVSFDTVEWANGCDLCPEVLYTDSSRVSPPSRSAGRKTLAVAEKRASYGVSRRRRSLDSARAAHRRIPT